MEKITKRTYKDWLIFSYNFWLKSLVDREIEVEALNSQPNMLNWMKEVSAIKRKVKEAKLYIKVIKRLLNKLNKKNGKNAKNAVLSKKAGRKKEKRV